MFFETCVDKNIRLTFCQWRKKIWQQEENQLQEDPLERKLPGERQLQEENLLEENKGLSPYLLRADFLLVVVFLLAAIFFSSIDKMLTECSYPRKFQRTCITSFSFVNFKR